MIYLDLECSRTNIAYVPVSVKIKVDLPIFAQHSYTYPFFRAKNERSNLDLGNFEALLF